MNIIVDRPQLVRVALLYLNKNFGNLTPKSSSEYLDSIFYVDSDNNAFMKYNQKNGYVFIHHDQIWSKIRSLFSLSSGETRLIMMLWLEETYNLRGVTPVSYYYI